MQQENLEQDYFVWEDWFEGGKWVDGCDLPHLNRGEMK